ncbi:MAG: prepilin-type N-terminal cleavage/methylation domain-containing protein [Lentisphaeria bacterium]|nr:prepilin-type N-terminal cleavage/methylation domain-containing protein [Lentisphaerota bacterium]MBR2626595.1 prepilin-type N-terminal cleavage/methylation domain-containing protein [Lentisphaeria bacterium]
MRFTLIEVVIALAILSLSLAGMFRLLSSSQLRIANAEEKYREMHMLTQGVEYLMLTGTEEDLSVPDEVFPYTDYLIDCTVEEADGLPEELTGQENQLPLKKWVVHLIRASDREERLSVTIDRLDLQITEVADE